MFVFAALDAVAKSPDMSSFKHTQDIHAEYIYIYIYMAPEFGWVSEVMLTSTLSVQYTFTLGLAIGS